MSGKGLAHVGEGGSRVEIDGLRTLRATSLAPNWECEVDEARVARCSRLTIAAGGTRGQLVVGTVEVQLARDL